MPSSAVFKKKTKNRQFLGQTAMLSSVRVDERMALTVSEVLENAPNKIQLRVLSAAVGLVISGS